MKVERTIINNCKIARIIRQNDGLDETVNKVKPFSLKTGPVYSRFTISFKPQADDPHPHRLTPYECACADAAFSLFMDGNTTFSVRKLLVAVTGNSAIHPSADRLARTAQILEKLFATEIDIACGYERASQKQPQLADRYCGPILPIYWDEDVEPKLRRYTFLEGWPLPLHDYAAHAGRYGTGQLIRFPLAALGFDAPAATNTLPASEENTLLKRYLVERLYRISGKKNEDAAKGKGDSDRSIALLREDGAPAEMLLALGDEREAYTSAGWKKHIRSLRDKVDDVLGYWEQCGCLEGHAWIPADDFKATLRVEITGKVRNPAKWFDGQTSESADAKN